MDSGRLCVFTTVFTIVTKCDDAALGTSSEVPLHTRVAKLVEYGEGRQKAEGGQKALLRNP